MNGTGTASLSIARLRRGAWIAGLGGSALCLLGAALNLDQFLRSYLLAFLFWLGIALGGAGVVMMHYLVGGNWGLIVRRPLEAATATLPLMALLSIVFVFLGMRRLYEWTHADSVARDELLRHKQAYLNVPFFWMRTIIYFVIWIGLAWLLRRWSDRMEAQPDAAWARRLRLLSGPGLVLYGLTMTFAAIDWVMSLSPQWYSTIYSVIFLTEQGVAAFAFAIIMLRLLLKEPALAGVITAERMHDLGNLLLAFIMLWAYVSLSQFIIIWSGNLPEEVRWYAPRAAGGWGVLAVLLALFHFFAPFLLLLSRDVKLSLWALPLVALLILAVRWIDLLWIIAPAFENGRFHIHWLDVVAPLALGGIWVLVFVWRLERRALLPPEARHLRAEAEGHG
ncbi:MAG TPA: hypothetical protein VGM03_21245 [Phycisphaerae bacterium]|jgi:hypothetical protein